MGVLPPAQGQRASRERRRVARRFVQCAVDHVADRPIQALVDESNLAARLMYGELGWEVVGKVHIGWPIPQLVYQAPRRRPAPAERSRSERERPSPTGGVVVAAHVELAVAGADHVTERGAGAFVEVVEGGGVGVGG